MNRLMSLTALALAVIVTTSAFARPNGRAGALSFASDFQTVPVMANIAGAGGATFQSPDSAGGTHNNRFIVSAEVRTTGGRFGTTVPALEFAGSSSRSFSPGITVDTNTRTNVGCFNQANAANKVKATVFDATGKLVLGSVELNLAANAWGQTGISTIVSGGYVQFDPADAAVCYAVVVDNSTNDGRLVPAAEYLP